MTDSVHSHQKEAGEVLAEIANFTLGDWAMMLTEDSSSDILNDQDLSSGFITSLNLKGPQPGKINILASKQFAMTLHQNLAGDFADDIATEELMDCLKEMTNVTAGRLVSEVFGENAVYDLTDLSCQLASEEDINGFLAGETTVFLLGDDCPVGFSLKI